MKNTMRFAGLVAAAAVTILYAPPALADASDLPVAGSENASDTINDITAAGYTPMINWVHGVPHVGLSQCTVNSIDAAASNGGDRTVYVTVDCPK